MYVYDGIESVVLTGSMGEIAEHLSMMSDADKSLFSSLELFPDSGDRVTLQLEKSVYLKPRVGADEFSEVEVPTDKENVLRLLNAEGGHESGRGRKWALTPRGGLREITEE